MSVELGLDSRLLSTPLRKDDGVEYWGLWVGIKFPAAPDDAKYTVTRMDIGRLDLIAAMPTYYNNSRLWWAIAQANNLEFPQDEMYIGQILRIPSLTAVMKVISDATRPR